MADERRKAIRFFLVGSAAAGDAGVSAASPSAKPVLLPDKTAIYLSIGRGEPEERQALSRNPRP